MSYVIKRKEDGAYHCEPSNNHGASYTRNLGKAKIFISKVDAEGNCCGNEYVVSVESQMEKAE